MQIIESLDVDVTNATTNIARKDAQSRRSCVSTSPSLIALIR
jgi:hypothetical protein